MKLKYCDECGYDQDINNFYGKSKYCKDCQNTVSRRIDKIRLNETIARKCATCKIQKSGKEFYIGERRCKSCCVIRSSASARVRKTGWTSEQYQKAFKEQNGKCFICKQVESNKLLAADHNHSTGARRALLCQNCNFLIGHAYENPEILRSAAEYLEAFSSNTLVE